MMAQERSLERLHHLEALGGLLALRLAGRLHHLTTELFGKLVQVKGLEAVPDGGRPHSRLRLLQAWLEEFEELYRRFLARDFAAILDEWRRLTVTLGQPVTVRATW